MANRFLFRADGSARIGLGHLYRSLAILESLRDSTPHLYIATKRCPPILLQQFRHLGVQVLKMPVGLSESGSLNFLQQQTSDKKIDVVITDLWPVTHSFIQKMRSRLTPTRLVCMDSGSLSRPVADVLINPFEKRIGQFRSMRCYGGPRYFPLRPALLAFRGKKKNIRRRARKVIVTMGGADPGGATLKILSLFENFKEKLDITVIVGPAFRFFKKLQESFRSQPWLKIVVSPPHIASLFFESDLCLSAGGFTLYELAFLGVPTLGVAIEEHQLKNLQIFEKEGVVLGLGRAEDLKKKTFDEELQKFTCNFSLRQQMSLRGRALVDGLGAERVKGVLLNL